MGAKSNFSHSGKLRGCMKNLSSRNRTNMANQKFKKTNMTSNELGFRPILIGIIVLASIFMCFGLNARAGTNTKAISSQKSKLISEDKPLRDKKTNRERSKTIIEIKGNTISIDVENANLFDVLDEIGLKTGVKITIEKNVINNKITAKYKGQEIETALIRQSQSLVLYILL